MFASFTKCTHHDTYPSISVGRSDLSAEGKVVLITGAGSGIGQATAIAFAQAKAKTVVVCGRRNNSLEETKDKIQALSLETDVIVQVLDISSEDNVDIVFQKVHKQAGPIDVVINSAGHLAEAGTLRDTTVPNFWSSFEVDVKGAFLIGRAFLRHCVKDDGKDRVFFLLSTLLCHLPATEHSFAPASYAVSKLALAKLAEYFAAENPKGFRAYALHPGSVPSDMSERSVQMAPEGTRERVPWDTAELPAHFMLWLASKRGVSVPSGRFLWVNWDVDELEARSQELKDDPYLCSMTLGGWPFDGKVRGAPL